MPQGQPRLDRESLAQLGRELQVAHHLAEKEPLTEQQRDLLLEWAVKEALEAAQGEALAIPQPVDQLGGTVIPLHPPQRPQPIATAPRATAEHADPVLLLLYAPEQGGWHTGFWSAGRWRTRLAPEVELQPTHWLPPMLGPAAAGY